MLCGRLGLLRGTPSRGSHIGRKRWHPRGESANAEVSTRHRASARVGPASGLRGCTGVDLDAFRWLLTDDGPGAAGPGRRGDAEHAGDPLRAADRAAPYDADAEHVAAALTQVDAAARGRWRSSATTPRGCTSPPTGSSRPPGCRSPTHRAARLRGGARPRSLIDLGCGIGGDLLAVRPGRAHRAPASTSTRCGSRWRGPTSPRSGSAAPCRSPTRRRSTPRRSTWPSPTRPAAPAGAGRSTSTTGRPPWPFVEALLRRDAVRQGRAGHPARPGARRRRGRVGQRPRRGQGGGAVVRPARHHRAGAPP